MTLDLKCLTSGVLMTNSFYRLFDPIHFLLLVTCCGSLIASKLRISVLNYKENIFIVIKRILKTSAGAFC